MNETRSRDDDGEDDEEDDDDDGQNARSKKRKSCSREKDPFVRRREISFLDGKEGKTSFFDVEEQSFDRNATLYQVAVEWVF